MAFALEFQIKAILCILGSMILGGLIGIDREMQGKAAGVRTHAFVAGAATLFSFLGEHLVFYYQAYHPDSQVEIRPFDILQAIVTGISFLGAGTILRDRGQKIQGLTTAASLLFTAGVGIAVAQNLWLLSCALVLIAFVFLKAIGEWEERFKKRALVMKKESS